MSMHPDPRRRRVIVGVDTHKYIHVAVALDAVSGVVDARSFTADRAGYDQLIGWAAGLGQKLTFAIEGTGSYGAGLTAPVWCRGIGVVEVMRTDRRDHRLRGKSDTLDAENAARAVLSGKATAVPKGGRWHRRDVRQVKVAKDVAVKARTAAMITLKQVIVTAPPELREQLQDLSKMALIRRCAGLRPGPVTTVPAAAKHAPRSIARALAAAQRRDQGT
jgi:transposase